LPTDAIAASGGTARGGVGARSLAPNAYHEGGRLGTMPTWVDRGIGIFELVSDAKQMTSEAFEAKHGSYFLIRTLDDGSLSPAASPFMRTSTTAIVHPGEMGKQKARLENPEASYVYSVRPRVPGHAVTIGRTDACDVHIDDKSLSKEHAELFVRSDGSLAIIDRNSSNGTYVGNIRLEPGLPTAVQFGKTITFGGVRLTYMPVRQLIDFIRVTFDDEIFADEGFGRTRSDEDEDEDVDTAFDIDVQFDDK